MRKTPLDQIRPWLGRCRNWIENHLRRGTIPAEPLTLILATIVGLLGGYGAVLFTLLIAAVTKCTIRPLQYWGTEHPIAAILLVFVPALGLLAVSWFTRRYAPEAQGHGVPEVITAVARNDGIIRPRVSLVKILASGVCIGTGGSIGREGPIVQIGSSLGSVAGQWFRLSARNIKVLVAAGAAAGISATFHAPLAGVLFASEIILGSFAVESLTPVVIASVIADVVQTHVGEHGVDAAFRQLDYEFHGAWEQFPSYIILGLMCGLAAVGFTKFLYFVEDFSQKWLPKWWMRAFILGACVGVAGVAYPSLSPSRSPRAQEEIDNGNLPLMPLFGVGYRVVDHALHLETSSKPTAEHSAAESDADGDRTVRLGPTDLLAEFWWLLPLAFLKPVMTCLTLGGGGSGGIFAPSLFLGATLGGAFGIACNVLVPSLSANPGVYAIVGMGAVVAGTTQATLSAILIVYEMTNDYRIILPIMATAGLASVVASLIDPESIYHKKLSRRGEKVARGHDMHRLEHIMVRNVMIRDFPRVRRSDNLAKIIDVARHHSHIESLPVMDANDKLVGIIRPEDLHRALDSEMPPELLCADDIVLASPLSVSPHENLLEALRDFGTRDVETLPVESGKAETRRLIGLLMRSDVMRVYREEMLRAR